MQQLLHRLLHRLQHCAPALGLPLFLSGCFLRAWSLKACAQGQRGGLSTSSSRQSCCRSRGAAWAAPRRLLAARPAFLISASVASGPAGSSRMSYGLLSALQSMAGAAMRRGGGWQGLLLAAAAPGPVGAACWTAAAANKATKQPVNTCVLRRAFAPANPHTPPSLFLRAHARAATSRPVVRPPLRPWRAEGRACPPPCPLCISSCSTSTSSTRTTTPGGTGAAAQQVLLAAPLCRMGCANASRAPHARPLIPRPLPCVHAGAARLAAGRPEAQHPPRLSPCVGVRGPARRDARLHRAGPARPGAGRAAPQRPRVEPQPHPAAEGELHAGGPHEHVQHLRLVRAGAARHRSTVHTACAGHARSHQPGLAGHPLSSPLGLRHARLR